MSKRPPGRELFFAPLEVIFSPTTLEQVQFAYVASKYGHYKQIREDGSRYFDHPKAAAWIYINELQGHDPRQIIVILLHDISEDSHILSPYRISLNLGKEVALDVRSVTKLSKGKETVEEYIKRIIARGPRAITGKLCDRLHNLRTLGSSSQEKRNRQIKETKKNYLPILIPALREFGDPWSGYADKLEEKIKKALKEIPK